MPGFPLSQLLVGAGNARNAFVSGRRDAQQQAQDQGLQQALQMYHMKRQAQQDQLAQALQAAQMRNIESQISMRRPPPTPRDPVADHLANRLTDVQNPLPSTTPARPASMTPGTPEWADAEKKKAQIGAQYGYHPPQTPPAVGMQVLPGVEGQPTKGVITSTHDTSQLGTTIDLPDVSKQAGGGMGSAAIKTKVGSNRALAQTIDAAIADVRKNPDAFGLVRGIPVVGDALNQRINKTGVAPRAKIANIGSQKMHDRSGAAVTAKEFPRLAPFIPAINDTPEAIITKLEEMKKVVEQETTELERTGNIPAVSPLGGGRGGGNPAQSSGGGRTITVNGKTFRVPD